MTNEEAKKRLEVWLMCVYCPEEKKCYDSYLHSTCEYTNYCDDVSIEEAIKVAIEALEQKPCENAISRYQKIKQMLYELKEMPLAPCLMKGHICAVHEVLNEVIDPSASSSQKPKSECEHDHEILKAYSDGANAVLDNVRAEIEERKLNSGGEPNRELAFNVCLQIIDGYMTEEDKA